MCVGLLAGCGAENTKESGDGKVTLDVWDIWTDPSSSLTTAFEDAVAQYEEEHRISISNCMDLTRTPTKQKCPLNLQERPRESTSIYYWAPGMIRKLIEADKVLPIDEYVHG